MCIRDRSLVFPSADTEKFRIFIFLEKPFNAATHEVEIRFLWRVFIVNVALEGHHKQRLVEAQYIHGVIPNRQHAFGIQPTTVGILPYTTRDICGHAKPPRMICTCRSILPLGQNDESYAASRRVISARAARPSSCLLYTSPSPRD